MKKLALVFAVVLIAAFTVTPATASDFSAGGQYRFEAVSSDPGAGASSKYFDQRMRVAFNWKVNDNVSTQLRGDFAEFQWGDGYRPEEGNNTIMIDRAFVKITQGIMTLTVGQQGGAWGLGTLWSDQFQGIQASFDFKPVTLNLLYVKESEGGDTTLYPYETFDSEGNYVAAEEDGAVIGGSTGNTLTDQGTDDDTDTYGASLLYANDAFSGGLSFATMRNDATNDTKNGGSLHIIVPINNFTLSGAAELFNGDDGAGTDYAGTQLHVALDAVFSETFKGGITVLWADEVDDDETQLTAISNDWVFKPLDYDGALAYNNGYFGGSVGLFDPSGNNNGVTAIVGDVQINLAPVTIWAKLGYAEPNGSDNLDSNMYAVLNADYAWMPAVTLSAGVGYVKPDYVNSATNDDAQVGATVQLSVSF